MIKAEQPYSVIHQTNSDSDPNKLGSWERPPHNSNKITRQNLDDAFAVNNVFKDSINTGNSMWAPEGDSNDYFLKAKDNLVGQQNDRKIGDFLSQFPGMDYFRKGVPAMEEGLKGTGYDMGPSANIVKDNLKEAVDEGDTKEVESIIEEHPEESQEVLPEDTPIQEEAEQITDDTNKINDEVNNEVVEDFVNDIRFKDIENKPYYDDWINSEPGSEQFMNAYNSVVNDYGKEEADRQLEAWDIKLPKDEDKVEDTNVEDTVDDFEAFARSADDEAGSRKQVEAERVKYFEEKLKHNNQEAWKDYALEKGKLNTRGSIRKGFEKEVGKSILAEMMTPEEWMNDSLRENVLRHTTFTNNPVEVRNSLRESINKEKKALGIDEETLKAKEEEDKKRKEEEKKRRDEAWAKFDKANGINQDKKEAPGSSFMNIPNTSKNKRPNNQFHEYNEQEFKSLPWANDFMNANPISDKFAKAVAEADKYYGPDWTNKQLAARGIKIRNANDIENNIESGNEQDEVNDSNLPALNLQDYHKDLALNGERELSDDVDYRVVEDSDYVPTTYTIEDLDREIEEVSQWPVTNAEEAKEKQKKLKLLKSRKVAYGSTSTSDTNWNYDRSNATGGRVSPKAGIGSIGGASGHGSMATTKPTKIGDSHNSIASKAPLPHALEDNQGRVVSINGKATTAPSSNNNGAFRSGSFGLMSKAKSNLKPIPSKAPVSSGPEHKGSSMTANGIGGGIPGEINVDDGKSALVERIKQLLAQLTDDEKKEFGFSAELNTWNGKSLNKLDGYTLQGLIDKLEEYLRGK